MDISIVKNEFTDIFNSKITRQGADKLLEYLSNSDFFTAPASARFHLAEEGGLCKHSLNVYKRLLKLVKDEYGDDYANTISDETIAVCGLLHDICKVNFYTVDYRNSKENGAWVKVPYYKVDEKFPYGHGEKSVFIISQYMRLTPEEAMSINWHMGGFDSAVKGGDFGSGKAYEMCPLAVLLHLADMTASYLMEEHSD